MWGGWRANAHPLTMRHFAACVSPRGLIHRCAARPAGSVRRAYVGRMPYQSTYRRRISVTLLRAGASVLGLDLALFVAGTLDGHLQALDPLGSLSVLASMWWLATAVPLGWAILGGAVLDHKLARRGPWWPLLVHPLGLMSVGALVMLVIAVIVMVNSGSPVGFLAVFFVAPVPFLGIAGVFATWLIPGSFPAYVPRGPTYPYVAPPGSPSGLDWRSE